MSGSKNTILPQEYAKKVIDILGETEKSKLHFRTRIDFFNEKIEQWDSASWRVGLIGITSSGKSTLINGFLGEELLPATVRPTSNCLIMIRYGKDKKVVKYYENSVVEESSKNLKHDLNELGNELNNPTNTKNVKHLSVFSPNFKLNHSITLCDTPGLDAYEMPKHDEITINNILPSLDLVLYVSTIRMSPAENSRIIKLISETKKPLIWVHNFMDTIAEKREKDGVISKTREQVISEHKIKVQENIAKSGLITPDNIPVVFVSARDALNPAKYSESGFKEFIDILHHEINGLEPKFVAGRRKQISTELSLIVDRETNKKTHTHTKLTANKEQIDEHIKELNSIKNKHQKHFNSIYNGFDSFRTNTLRDISLLYQSSVKEAGDIRKKLQQTISESNSKLNQAILNMNAEFQKIGKKHNIRNEDFFHGSVTTAPSIHIQTARVTERTETVRVEKKSISGLGIRKALGNLFGTNWGYDVYEETVLEIENIEGYKHDLRNAISREQTWLADNTKQSFSALQNYYDIILRVLDTQKKSIIEAIEHTIPENTVKKIVSQLCQLKDTIDKENAANLPSPSKKHNKKSISTTPIAFNDGLIKVDILEMKLMRFLNSVANKAFQFHLEDIIGSELDKADANLIILHWDHSLFSEFWRRYFSQHPLPNIHYSKVQLEKRNISVIQSLKENTKIKEKDLLEIPWQQSHLFIMISVSQIGFFEKKYHESDVIKNIKKSKKIIPVIADFSDFWDNNNLAEYLIAFDEFLQKSKIRPYRIMINNDSLALGQIIENLILRKYPISNERDEIDFIDKMDKKGYFLNKDMKIKIANILPEWRNHINGKKQK